MKRVIIALLAVALAVATGAEVSAQCFADGDVNNDGIALTVADLSYLTAFLNGQGPAPPVTYKADLTGNGIVDGADVNLYKAYFIHGLMVFDPYGGYPVPCPCSAVAGAVSIYLAGISGLGGREDVGAVIGDETVIFEIGLTNQTGLDITYLGHGFKVYSPTGASWEPLEYAYHHDFPAESFFDVVWSGDYSNNGSGEDSVGFVLNAGASAGDLNGYDDIILRIGTTPMAWSGPDTLCIDSVTVPFAGAWEWETIEGFVTPMWNGPYCFEIRSNSFDTIVVEDVTYASRGLCELSANPSSSITLNGGGPSGNDGVSAEYSIASSVNVSLNGGDSLPSEGAIICQVYKEDERGCCLSWGHCATMLESSCQSSAFIAGGECFLNIQYEWECGDGFPHWSDFLHPVDIAHSQLVIGNLGNDSLILEPIVIGDNVPYVAYVCESGVVQDSLMCPAGTEIFTPNGLPGEVEFQDGMDIRFEAARSFKFPVRSVTYTGDEVRVRPITRSEHSFSDKVVVYMAGMDSTTIKVTPVSCCLIRGDIDYNGTGPDIADLVYLVAYMFNGGPEPPCMEASDINGDGGIPDIADLVSLVAYMFQGGHPPEPCVTR